MESNEIEFKLLLVGDPGVGKTSFINRYITGEFDSNYNPSTSLEIQRIKFQTNSGNIYLKIWNLSGEINEQYLVGGQCGIIMFDVTSRSTYKSVLYWYNLIFKVCENIPIVLIANKIDSVDRKMKSKNIIFHRKHNLQLYEISSKSNCQIEGPFHFLLKKLTANPYLNVIEGPSLVSLLESITAIEEKTKIQEETFGENNKKNT